ncbi:MAG: DinB family protein [Acidimicrobiales bacterium]
MTSPACAECGLDSEALRPLDAINAVRTFPYRYRAVFKVISQEPAFDEVVHRRPEPRVWSAVEYAAHAADMIDRSAPAIRRMQSEERPSLPFFDPPGRVDSESFNDRSLMGIGVMSAMETACSDMASTLETVEPNEWARTGVFDWGERDILSAARNAVHEGTHHLLDIERVLARVLGG